MPELPEVETVRRGLESHVLGRSIARVDVRDRRLRVPVDEALLARTSRGRRIEAIDRRAKYLLMRLDSGDVILMHLGMSGRMAVVPKATPFEPHTHVVLELDDGREIRFRDPRRFGLVQAIRRTDVLDHALLRDLGIEPFSTDFTPEFLVRAARGLKKPVKNFLMDGHVVVGVGNIYACESLFEAAISPRRAAGRLKRTEWSRLHAAVVAVLEEAVRQGGTTLNDFAAVDGGQGYFQVKLRVYDRKGLDCARCGEPVRRIVQAGRSTFYCRGCQH